MKNSLSVILIVFIFFIISSCTKEIPDPTGTNTINMRTDGTGYVEWFTEQAKDAPCSTVNGGYAYNWVRKELQLNGGINFFFHMVVSFDSNFSLGNPHTFGINGGGQIVNLGPVEGLGSITSKPTAGWTSTSAVEEGNGYVVRFNKSINNSADVTYYYGRLYVVDFITSATTGGIIGATVKFQYPF